MRNAEKLLPKIPCLELTEIGVMNAAAVEVIAKADFPASPKCRSIPQEV
jgi:hypothetical protein